MKNEKKIEEIELLSNFLCSTIFLEMVKIWLFHGKILDHTLNLSPKLAGLVYFDFIIMSDFALQITLQTYY